jgi:transcriptional regulator of acetoin/glycerol metabolism
VSDPLTPATTSTAQLEALFSSQPFKLGQVEDLLIAAAIVRQKGCISRAAEELGIGRTTIYRHYRRLGMTVQGTPLAQKKPL